MLTPPYKDFPSSYVQKGSPDSTEHLTEDFYFKVKDTGQEGKERADTGPKGELVPKPHRVSMRPQTMLSHCLQLTPPDLYAEP